MTKTERKSKDLRPSGVKPEKQQLVENLANDLAEAKSVVLVDYSGMNVVAQRDLQKRLREVGAKMLVVKNTLIKLAGQKAKVAEEALEESILTGQTALILSSED